MRYLVAGLLAFAFALGVLTAPETTVKQDAGVYWIEGPTQDGRILRMRVLLEYDDSGQSIVTVLEVQDATPWEEAI